jgi:hypothetical protein
MISLISNRYAMSIIWQPVMFEYALHIPIQQNVFHIFIYEMRNLFDEIRIEEDLLNIFLTPDVLYD